MVVMVSACGSFASLSSFSSHARVIQLERDLLSDFAAFVIASSVSGKKETPTIFVCLAIFFRISSRIYYIIMVV